jgi:hypothetical protein
MSDKYQAIRDREYARLALIHTEIDRKHKSRMRILTTAAVLLFIAMAVVIYEYWIYF